MTTPRPFHARESGHTRVGAVHAAAPACAGVAGRLRRRAPLAGMLALALASLARPGLAQQAGAQPGAVIPTEAADPALVRLVPADLAGKPFTVAVALGSPPDDFRDEHGAVVGWEVDILRAATQALGLPLELRPTTFDTLIPGLQAKRFDAAVGQMGVTAVREKVVDMVGTLLANEQFAALSDSTIQVGRWTTCAASPWAPPAARARWCSPTSSSPSARPPGASR